MYIEVMYNVQNVHTGRPDVVILVCLCLELVFIVYTISIKGTVTRTNSQ